MSGIDLLYMSEILTKFNHSLGREWSRTIKYNI
jgi:hypothetical protein